MSYRKKGLWLIIPSLIGFLLFYIIPFIYSFYFTLINNTFTKKFVGLDNFIKVLNNKYYCLALRNTFEFTLIGVPILVTVSFFLAILLASRNNNLSTFKAPFIIPILLPSAAVVMIWKVLFRENGFINEQIISNISFLKSIGYHKIAIYTFFIWKNAGFNMVLFIAGLINIPGEIYEASEIDGAGPVKKHIFITMPLILPTTFFIFIISTINSFKIFKEVYLLYGAYPKEAIYFIQHYMNNHFSKLNYQNLTTGAVIFALIVYGFVSLGYRFENRISKGVW